MSRRKVAMESWPMRWVPRSVRALFSITLVAACAGAPAKAPPPKAAPAPPAAKAPAEPPPTPIDAELPSMVPPTLPLRAVCRMGTCSLSRLVPEEIRGSVPEKGALLLWEQMIGGKARVVFPTDKEVTLAGVVLEGEVGLLSRENQWGAPAKMKQWQGFHAPGGGVTLIATTRKPARVALVIAVAGAEASLATHVERWNKDRKPFEWKKRSKSLDRIDFTALPVVSWGQGGYHARVGWEAGGDPGGAPAAADASTAAAEDGPAMVMNMLRFSKDAGWTAHVHEKSRECLAVLEGDGELSLTLGPTDEGAAANKKVLALEPGVVVCIPEGMLHAWKPSGKEPFLALQVFSPPGPERLFQMLADKGL